MPTIDITITAGQVARLKAALTDPMTGVEPTADDLKQRVKNFLRSIVVDYETRRATQNAEIAKRAELDSEGW